MALCYTGSDQKKETNERIAARRYVEVRAELRMPLAPEMKAPIIEKYRLHADDSGSSDVQIALLGRRITDMLDHLRAHPHDNASRRGLLMMVGKRRRLLNYLRRTNFDRYRELITSLGLRR